MITGASNNPAGTKYIYQPVWKPGTKDHTHINSDITIIYYNTITLIHPIDI